MHRQPDRTGTAPRGATVARAGTASIVGLPAIAAFGAYRVAAIGLARRPLGHALNPSWFAATAT